METLIFSFIILAIVILFLGVGVFFFDQTGHREACGSVPHVLPDENCPSQQAGLCPIEDKTGVMKLANRAKITYNKQPIGK